MTAQATTTPATTESNALIEVAYWPDGYYDDDLEGAALVDSINAFGPVKHSILKVPAGASSEEIQSAVNQAIQSSS